MGCVMNHNRKSVSATTMCGEAWGLGPLFTRRSSPRKAAAAAAAAEAWSYPLAPIDATNIFRGLLLSFETCSHCIAPHITPSHSAPAMSDAVSSVIGFLEDDFNDASAQQDAAIADISADLELLRDDPRILKALRTGQDLTRYSRKVCAAPLLRLQRTSRGDRWCRWTRSCGRWSVTASRTTSTRLRICPLCTAT